MVTTLCIFFLATCYLFIKNKCKHLLLQTAISPQKATLCLKRAQITAGLGIIFLVMFYALSAWLIYLNPDNEYIKPVRRLADVLMLIINLWLLRQDTRVLWQNKIHKPVNA